MHAAERAKIILDLVRERGFVSFRELDKRIEASPATLRRDLERLEAEARLVRVHGGARSIDDAADEPQLTGVPFHENIARNAAEKALIGAAAAQLCRPGEAIIIDGGSTTLQMCAHLDGLDLQVLTNSLHIVSALLPQQRTRISVPGGSLFREQNIVLSPYENDGTGHYRASKMFLGAAAVGRHGVMQADVLLLQAERRLMERADELVLLVDSSKFDGSAGHVVCPLDAIDVLVTDEALSAENRRLVEDAGVQLIIAS